MFHEFASCYKIVVSPKIVLRFSEDCLRIWAKYWIRKDKDRDQAFKDKDKNKD